MAGVDHIAAPTQRYADDRAFRVVAPQPYDGIGRALRSAYHDRLQPQGEWTVLLRRLDEVDLG